MKLIAPEWLIAEGLKRLAAELEWHPPGTCLYCDARRAYLPPTSFAPSAEVSENPRTD